MEEPTADQLALVESGSGRLAVFIHGFPLDARMWTDQLELLGDSRRCVAVDLPGHGRSPWRGQAVHTMEDMAGAVAQSIETLALDGADVVGLSMGGYVALALAEASPHLVRSLTLVDTRATPDDPSAQAGRDQLARDAVAHGRSVVAERMLDVLVAPAADLIVRARLRTMIESTPLETMVADLRGMRDRPDRTAVLRSLRAPILVIVGEEDRLTPPGLSEEMATAAECDLVMIEGAGHMSPMECPLPVAEAVARFWKSA